MHVAVASSLGIICFTSISSVRSHIKLGNTNIQIVKKNNSGVVTQSLKVPLAYGPKQKFLTRIREDASLNKSTAITLPRIAFVSEQQNSRIKSA